jgi:hypothetical protein
VGFYLVLEGAYALSRKSKPSQSLTYQFVSQRQAPSEAAGQLGRYLYSRRQLEDRFPLFRKHRLVLGNSPFHDLATEETRVTVDDPLLGRRFKPGLTVRSSPLRSRLFDPLYPISYSYIVRESEEPDGKFTEFLDRYAFREVTWTTDEDGFRTTLPRTRSGPMIALVGSSPCVGVFLEDEETLASLLQREYGDFRFLNACVSRTTAANHAAMVASLSEQFGDELVGGIYTINEKNYESVDSALEAVDRVADSLESVGAVYRVLVYHHYIYETMPDVFRKNRRLEASFSDKAEVLTRARERGFAIVDSYELVRAYREAKGSLGSGLALYVDHVHPSREGNELLAEAIPPPYVIPR